MLSHGQAVIERGLNVNNEVLAENLEEKTLTCIRLVYDQITTTKLKVYEIPIPRELIISCNDASKRYKAALDKKAKAAEETKVEKKRKLKQEEIVRVKHKETEVKKVMRPLSDDIEKMYAEVSARKYLKR